MDRRTFLTTSGSIVVLATAGCLGGSPESEGDDNSPIDAEPEELLPSANLFGDGWEQHDNESLGLHSVELEGSTAKAAFHTDEAQQGVDVEVTVFDSVDEAISGYNEMHDADSEGSGDEIEDIGVASEGYLFDAFDSVYFRDANVIGMLVHVSDTSSTKPVEYAADWHETWRN